MCHALRVSRIDQDEPGTPGPGMGYLWKKYIGERLAPLTKAPLRSTDKGTPPN